MSKRTNSLSNNYFQIIEKENTPHRFPYKIYFNDILISNRAYKCMKDELFCNTSNDMIDFKSILKLKARDFLNNLCLRSRMNPFYGPFTLFAIQKEKNQIQFSIVVNKSHFENTILNAREAFKILNKIVLQKEKDEEQEQNDLCILFKVTDKEDSTLEELLIPVKNRIKEIYDSFILKTIDGLKNNMNYTFFEED